MANAPTRPSDRADDNAAIRVREIDDDRVAENTMRAVHWSRRDNARPYDILERNARESDADVELVSRMDVVCVADVDRDRLSGIRQRERRGHRFTLRRPTGCADGEASAAPKFGS